MSLINLVGLRAPPRRHLRVERVGGLQSAEFDGRGEARREVDAHAVRAEGVGDGRGLAQVLGAQAFRVGVDVVERRAVDADRRVGARVVAQARIDFAGQRVPVPQRTSRVAALDAAVEVVPVVEHAKLKPRLLAHVQITDGLKRLHQPQEVERAVERARLAARSDDRDDARAEFDGADAEAFGAERGELSLPAESVR